MPVINQIAIATETVARQEYAAELARQLGLPLAESATAGYALLLVVTAERLELRQTGPKAPGPVWVDFIGGKARHRRQKGGGRKQTLVRAIGVKGKNRPTVLDGTAGLGQDSFVLACQGCKVEMVERNPVIALLLEDGLRRAEDNSEIGEVIKRMTMTKGDSLTKMTVLQSQEQPQVVYLDPMYPHRSQSALVKKEMRILRALVGDDEDSDHLLALALKVASKRVVVKRPIAAPPLLGLKPDLISKTKNHRFDIYLIKT